MQDPPVHLLYVIKGPPVRFRLRLRWNGFPNTVYLFLRHPKGSEWLTHALYALIRRTSCNIPTSSIFSSFELSQTQYPARKMSPHNTITVSLPQLAKMIDHSLLHPTMTDADILAGLKISRESHVATACVKPYLVPLAKKELSGTDVLVCAVIGFPHGNSTTEIKVAETIAAAKAGAAEIDMVVNIGKVLGGDWGYVKEEIAQIKHAAVAHGATLKVIFENDYLKPEHISHLCKICTELHVAFVKTSTGYGFVKQTDGSYNYKGATVSHLKLMREKAGKDVQVKAAGGVRTLDDLLHVIDLGVTRIGATATVAILDEARRRGIGEEPVEVSFKPMKEGQTVGY